MLITSRFGRSDVEHGIQPNIKRRAKTLIVLPTVAIRQWQTEILRFTRTGSLNVHVYHGTNRSIESSLKTLMEADVVLTSYKIIELEYRKATAGTKIECSICGKKYYPEKLRIHRKYFCGDNAKLTEAQSKTERKKKTENSKAVCASDESEGDEIDKQKRMIKKMRENEGAKGGARARSKVIGGGEKAAPKTARGKRKAASVCLSDSEEDEVDKQKRMIKKMREDKEAKSVTKSRSRTKANRPKTPRAASDSSDAESESQRPVSGKNGKQTRGVTGKNKSRKKKIDSDCSDHDSDYQHSTSDDEEEELSLKGDRKSRGVGGGRWRSRNIIKAGQDSDGEDSADSEVEATIAEALRESARKAVPSLIHELSWFRVILDEAHLIKDRSTSTARAAFNLVSLNKWCLTGTPLQNRVGELYSLVRFLRMDPFAFYFCKAKNCNCKSLHYVRMLL